MGVPLGALVTPLPQAGDSGFTAPPRVRRPPVTCNACGAFLNLYCRVSSTRSLPLTFRLVVAPSQSCCLLTPGGACLALFHVTQANPRFHGTPGFVTHCTALQNMAAV